METLEQRHAAGGRGGTTLNELAEHLSRSFAVDVIGGGSEVRLVDASHDSGHEGTDWLFCCLPGTSTHGVAHARAAVAGGAAAILTDVRSTDLDRSVPQIVVSDVRAATAAAAARIHGDPSTSIAVVGVTGTNGKTTTAAMLAAILRAAGHPTAELGTLHGARTTPEATDFQRFLAAQRDAGVTHVVAEVSSHALALHRVDATLFAAGVFTNLGRDHLDFHGTEEAYVAAKSRLFTGGFCRNAIVNVDDPRGREIASVCDCPVVAVRPSEASVTTSDLSGTSLSWSGLDLRVALAGGFNVANALLAAATCHVLDVDDDAIVRGLADCRNVRGRFTVLGGGASPTVVVDYAHTPDGLAELLRSVRSLAAGRLTVVFGCGGDRDQGKRPDMGRVAAEIADRVVVTADNPRNEDPRAIASDIVGGVAPRHLDRVETILDRESAIGTAIASAGEGDTVVVAGKGHESTQEFADRVVAFDDIEVVTRLLGGEVGR